MFSTLVVVTFCIVSMLQLNELNQAFRERKSLQAPQQEWLNLLAKNRILFGDMSSSIVLQGLLILVVSSLGSAYMQQTKHSAYQTARSMHQEPRTDRDQILNADALKVAGAVMGSLLFYPVVARAADVITGISDIAINYDGVPKPIGEYLGKKGTLIINVASQCALTPQYDDLVTLYNKYKADGFTILAFPCNQFGSQEPQPVERIRKDMKVQYNVEFPIFDKIEVNGGGASKLYTKLKTYDGLGTSTDSVKKISWNFEKFLIDPVGMPVRRYKPGIQPFSIDADIGELLATGKLKPRKRSTLNDDR